MSEQLCKECQRRFFLKSNTNSCCIHFLLLIICTITVISCCHNHLWHAPFIPQCRLLHFSINNSILMISWKNSIPAYTSTSSSSTYICGIRPSSRPMHMHRLQQDPQMTECSLQKEESRHRKVFGVRVRVEGWHNIWGPILK